MSSTVICPNCSKQMKNSTGLKVHQRTCKQSIVQPPRQTLDFDLFKEFGVQNVKMEMHVFEPEQKSISDQIEIADTVATMIDLIEQKYEKQTNISDVISTHSSCSHKISCQCGRKIVLENGQTTIQEQEVDIVETTQKKYLKQQQRQMLNQVPKNTYDIQVEKTLNGFNTYFLSKSGIFNNDQVQLMYSTQTNIYQPFEYQLLSPKDYGKYIVKESKNPMCPYISNGKAFRMKLASELSLHNTFEFPSKYWKIYWDIETFNANGQYHEIPKPENNYSFIGCIQYQIVDQDNNKKHFIITRNKYQFNKKAIKQNIGIKHLEIIQCETERQMCDYFIKILIGDQNTQNIPKFLIGFNSATTPVFHQESIDSFAHTYNQINGYDLGFLINRCSYILSPQNIQYKVSADTSFNLTKGFKQIQNLYIHDAMPLFAQQLSADDLKQLPNKSLDSFLSSFRIPNKLDHNYYGLQKQFHLNDGDFTQIFEYAMYDCICLCDTFVKRDIWGKIMGEMQIWNVPLSFQLYDTANTKNQVLLARELIKNKILPAYQVCEERQKVTFKGATTFVEKEYILKCFQNALCHDFASLYPSVISGFNLSPETHCLNPQLEFGDNWKEYVNIIDCSTEPLIQADMYFYKPSYKRGILPQVCDFFLDGRNQRKAQQKQLEMKGLKESNQWRVYENQQLALKVAANTFFGGLGSTFCPFYYMQFSASVTSQARNCLQKLKEIVVDLYGNFNGQPRIISGDTDSVFWQADDVLFKTNILFETIQENNLIEKTPEHNLIEKTPEHNLIEKISEPSLIEKLTKYFIGYLRKTTFKQIEEDINKKLNQYFPPIIKVCAEEILLRFVPSKAKKSYYRIEQNLANYFSCNDPVLKNITTDKQLKNAKLVAKGVQWSSLDTFARQSLKNLFIQHLTTNDNIQELLIKHISKIEEIVEQAIRDKNAQVLQQFCKRIKLAGKNRQSQYIRENHPDIIDDYCYVVPILFTGRKGSEGIVPIQAMTPSLFNMIDINQFLSAYKSQLHKFFLTKEEKKKQGKLKSTIKQIFDQHLIEQDQIIVRIEQLKNGYVCREIAVMTPQQAYNLGNDKKNFSIHEVIMTPYHKIFFDLDGKQQVNIQQFKCDLYRILSKNGIDHPLEMYTATCHRKDKFSYHIVTNIVVHRRIMSRIAKYMQKCGYPVDQAPYGEQDETMRSLRFINCVKIDTKTLKIVPTKCITNATPEQMAITLIDGCYTVKLPPILNNNLIFQFDNYYNQKIGSHNLIGYDKKVADLIHARLPNVQFERIVNNVIHLEYIQSNNIKCELCGSLHEFGTNKLYGTAYGSKITIKCWRDTEKKKISLNIELTEEQKEQEQKINPLVSFTQEFMQNQNQQFVKFDFTTEEELLAVKSAMGTGKTEQTIGILQEQKKRGLESTIIASARVVFSNNAQMRFNQNKDGTPTGLNVKQYSDVQGLINPNDGMTIVQVESFTRISDQPFELLILDEFQSIYEQLNSKLHKNPNQLHYKFVQMLSKAKRILVLDAQLKHSTLSSLEYYCGRQARIINNIYKPYKDFTFIIHPFKNKDDIDPMMEMCKEVLDQGKKVYSHINSKKKLFALTKHLQNAGHAVRNYHGDNLMNDENGQIHGKIKDTHFKDVDKHFKQYSAVLCNSAMGAGVDFSQDHFDIGLHCFFANTSSPMAFVQSLFRSRRFNEKVHHIWVQNQENTQSLSTAQYYNQFAFHNEQVNKSNTPINDPVFNLQMDLVAYKNAMNSNRSNIIISGLKDLGCKVIVEEQANQQQDKLYKKITKELPPMKLTEKTLKDVDISEECVKYFLADPKLKQQMIQTNQLKGNIQQQIQALSLVVVNKQIKNAQLADQQQALQSIRTGLQEIKALSVEQIKDQFAIYESSRQYRPYKQTFGIIHHLTQEEQIRVIQQKAEQSLQMYNQKIAQKGITPAEIQKIYDDMQKAIEFFHADDNQKEEIALKHFKYERKHFKHIYTMLGLHYVAEYKQIRNNGKRERVLDKITITPLPNAQITGE